MCDEPLPESLARAILELRRDTALRASLAAEGLKLMRSVFTPRQIGARLLEIEKRGQVTC